MTFTRALTVAAGDPITSRQYLSLARAFNDRLRSGVGDGTWRIFYLLHSFFRDLRDYVTEDDYWALRQAVDPASGTEWPASLPGSVGGVNRANPLGAFVFGQEGFNLEAEWERLGRIGWTSQPAISDADAWALGLSQCGAYDPATGALGSPSFAAARAHFAIAYGSRSKFAHAFGGYLAGPEVSMTGCEDPEPADDIPAPTNYEVVFTSLTADVDTSDLHGTITTNGDGSQKCAYAGTCEPAPGDDYGTHVAGIVSLPWAYYVRLNDGTVDELLANEWIEGPYEGKARLARTPENLQRVLHEWNREFRGDATQRAVPGYHVEDAVDFQRVLAGQYLLAPVRGEEDGDAVRALETRWKWTGTAAQGAFATEERTRGEEYPVGEGFAVAMLYVSAAGLRNPVTVHILDGETVRVRIQVAPDAEEAASRIVVLEPALVEPRLRVQLGGPLNLRPGSGSHLTVEIREQVDYKPLAHDLYLILRAASAGAVATGTDGHALAEEYARTVGERYLRQGILLNQHQAEELPEPFTAINTNGVMEAARRWSKACRVVRRDQLVKYAVEGGKSILWVRRLIADPDTGEALDNFEGIGPSRSLIASGSLRPDVRYVVRSGRVRYSGQAYAVDQVFTAGETATFEGAGTVMEHDGIQRTAPKRGTSNAWLVDVHLKPYHPSDTSDWFPAAFADGTLQFNRCHFGSPEIGNSSREIWHFGFGRKSSAGYGGVLISEAPTGYNYAPVTNAWLGRTSVSEVDCGDPPDATCAAWRLGYYRSCRIYEPPAEIESAVAETDTTGAELLKITFTTRLHHTPEAPSSVSEDVTTWDMATIAAESFRSLENGIREYLIHQQIGGHCTAQDNPPYDAGGPSGQPGNAAANTDWYTQPDDPFGTCYPTLILTQLVPEPYEDGNDSPDGLDSRFVHDPMTRMDLYLRAMCEGFVDGETTTDYACRLGIYSVFDFTFANLCVQAFGGRWISPLPESVRADRGEGFGPLPAVGAYAEVFNQLSSAVNLLNRARIMLPMRLEYQEATASESQSVTGLDGAKDPYPCTAGTSAVLYSGALPDPAPDFSLATWTVGDPPMSSVVAEFDGTCDGDDWVVTTTRTNVRVRWQPIDPDALEAIPDDLVDHLTDNPVILSIVETTNTTVNASITTVVGDSEECCFEYQRPCPGVWNSGGGQWWKFPLTASETTVCLDTSGAVTADPLAAGFVARAMTASGAECSLGPSNYTQIQVISDSTAVVEIPLADLP